jgi:lipoprotein-anchoring transpeptidase ErfK/SrfK
MNYFLYILLFCFSGNSPDKTGISEKSRSAETLLARLTNDYIAVRYPNQKIKKFIYVGVKRQKIYLISDTTVLLEYSVSTSKYGIGSEKHSEKTPLGLHKIDSKFGAEVPNGGIIKGKSYTGKMATIITEAKSGKTDEITTRAIRLTGIEKGLNKGGNKDSYERDIYIHGTPEEGLIGQPASHGCVRMKNADVITLFDNVDEDTYVLILNN